MRLAIPSSSGCVAPRFSVAERLLLVDIADDRWLRDEALSTSPGTATTRLRRLARRGVTHLVCGGFNRRYLPTASALGISVIWGQSGPVIDLAKRFVRGELPEPVNLQELNMTQKIAITVTDGRGIDGVTDPRFGRAAGFLILEPRSSQDPVFVPNPNIDAGHGAGTGAAALMAQHGVTDVISGHFGPKAFQALEGLEITMWLVDGGTPVSVVQRRHASGDLPAQRQH